MIVLLRATVPLKRIGDFEGYWLGIWNIFTSAKTMVHALQFVPSA